MHSFILSFAAITLFNVALAVPAPAPTAGLEPVHAVNLQNRQIDSVLESIASAGTAQNGSAGVSQYATITPTANPTDIAEVQTVLSSIFPSTTAEADLYVNVGTMIANSLAPSDIEDIADTYTNTTGENSSTNDNPAEPSSCVIYPQKNSSDAPYSVSEDTLRGAIYIPSNFTYGQKQPVILIPGTAAYGYLAFENNLIPMLEDSPYADLVWLNVPGAMLDDAQVNSEYVAYAINYINCVTNRTVALISWSQGGPDAQWAFKYWPSTQNATSDFIAISPDFHGTIFANALCLGAGGNSTDLLSCAPAVVQQEYDSNFITQLRLNGGDSAYVPTTTLYSGFFDEVVEPQQGTDASAYLLDARGVGVTNNEVQDVCPGELAGDFWTHESMLYNPITYYLIIDALTNDGPGEPSRAINSTVCEMSIAPGLTLENVVGTESLLVVGAVLTLSYEPKVYTEPALMSYATY